MRLIECKCGNWEEFPQDMPRHKSQSFEWQANHEDNNASYSCNECGVYVQSEII